MITKATSGGAQRYVLDLATNLPQEEFEPLVAYGESGRLARELKNGGIRTLELPSLKRDVALLSDIKGAVEIWRCLRRERPDALHLNSSKAAGLGALAGRLAGVPRIVFTAHGWPHKEPRNALSRFAILATSWITALLSDVVIVVSKDDEAIGKRLPLVESKVRYLPIGRALQESFTRETAQIFLRGVAPKLRANRQTPRVVTIAELTRNKGIRYAIEAIALLKQRDVACTYVVIGDGEEYEALRQLSAELGIEDRVALIGFLPDAARYLAAFDVFLLPSLKEGMPYVLLEAGDARLPIIATSAANPEIADTYQRVTVVPPGSAEDIAAALAAVFKEGAASSPLYEESRYPLRDMIERTLPLYRAA